ncbi:MAG: nucleotidyltransferase family protein [Anaerolineae bacterium]|jgi:predicted nucleotidyltransferase|nr:nucleotidyltransferase family protein [Anaerolineae bacterium]
MSIETLLDEKRAEILRIAAHHGATNVRIFGSVARGEAGPNSDVDFLIDLEPDRSLLDMGALLVELQDLLGCEVDIVTEASLYWLLRRRILKEARPL